MVGVSRRNATGARLLSLVSLAVLPSLSCVDQGTEAFIVIRAEDLTVPADIDRLLLSVYDRTRGAMTSSRTLSLCTPDHATVDCPSLPVSTTLIPGPTQPTDEVRLEVSAFAPGVTPAASSDVIHFQFVPGHSLRF